MEVEGRKYVEVVSRVQGREPFCKAGLVVSAMVCRLLSTHVINNPIWSLHKMIPKHVDRRFFSCPVNWSIKKSSRDSGREIGMFRLQPWRQCRLDLLKNWEMEGQSVSAIHRAPVEPFACPSTLPRTKSRPLVSSSLCGRWSRACTSVPSDLRE